MTERGTLTDPLLDDFDLDYEGRRVVAIGGGHGLAQALQAVGDYAGDITAVVAVADDGGSSGRLAPALGIPPPGDIRRALLALSPVPSRWRDLMEYRFESGDVAGHSLGNLIIAALADQMGDFEGALLAAGRMLGARGEVVPAASCRMELEAVVDGEVVRGQVAVARARGALTELRVLPGDAVASRSALDAIAAADQIVLGPGSLFTSVCAVLAVPGIAAAVGKAAAQVVYVCNLITQDGETLGMDAADHVRALLRHGGIECPAVVVAHDGALEIPESVEAVALDQGEIEALGARVETGDLADPFAEWPQHAPARLGAVLRRLA